MLRTAAAAAAAAGGAGGAGATPGLRRSHSSDPLRPWTAYLPSPGHLPFPGVTIICVKCCATSVRLFFYCVCISVLLVCIFCYREDGEITLYI